MALSPVKEYVYVALEPQENEEKGVGKVVEAQLNVMQTVFLVIQTSPSLEADILEKGLDIFRVFFNKYFTEASEVPLWESICIGSSSKES